MKITAALALAATIMAGGCASIVGESTQSIAFNSNPDQATITVTDKAGTTVHRGQTPATFVMNKSDGSYFGGQTYSVTVEKPGYRSVSVVLDTQPNGWYIGGNILFGGLIGWFVVDPLTGSMWTIQPDSVNAQLVEQAANPDDGVDSSLLVVLLEQVPEELRADLVALN